MELRPYQQELIKKIKMELCKGRKSVCAVLGCGGGKSIIQACIAKSATDKGNKVLFLVHRKELCEQIEQTFRKCGVDLRLCQISMVQTVSRRLGKHSWTPQIIITDECHHSLSGSYKKIYEYHKDAFRLGFTATPCRLDKSGLGEIYESMVEGVSTKWLIDNHYLSPYIYYGAKIVDTNGLRTTHGEFVASDVNELMNKRIIFGQAFENWQKFANGKKTIIYCAGIELSKKTAAQFRANNVRTAHLDGETPAAERKKIISDFREGKITVLSNVDLFGEGFDVPDCECVVLLRPTMSLTLHIQQSMRSMRYKEGKTAIIIDNVGNVYRHGLPDDKRDWTLESKRKRKQAEIKVKQCPKCMTCLPNTAKQCTTCGFIFETQTIERTDPENVTTELQRLSAEDLLRNKPYEEYRKITTWDEMEEFRKAKKYKFMWSIRKCLELGIKIPDKYSYLVRRFAI